MVSKKMMELVFAISSIVRRMASEMGFRSTRRMGFSSSLFERGVYSPEFVNGGDVHTICSEVSDSRSFGALDDADETVKLCKLDPDYGRLKLFEAGENLVIICMFYVKKMHYLLVLLVVDNPRMPIAKGLVVDYQVFDNMSNREPLSEVQMSKHLVQQRGSVVIMEFMRKGVNFRVLLRNLVGTNSGEQDGVMNIVEIMIWKGTLMVCKAAAYTGLDVFFQELECPDGRGHFLLKTLPLASYESCVAMEFYHNQLKLRLFDEKEPYVYLRADWLIDKLNTKVHSYFWLDEYSKKDDFARYRKDEWLSGLTAWRKSLKIPDSSVVLDGKYAKVFDQGDQDKFYTIWNSGSEFGICDCHLADLGNLCEHVLKVIRILSDRGHTMSSASMSKYSETLLNMLRCPHDFLIRDHAVSLAVWVQKQLAAQIDPENNQIMLDLQAAVPLAASNVTHNIIENNHANENIISNMETDFVGYDVSNSIINDSGRDLIGQVANGSVAIDPFSASADRYRIIGDNFGNENISSNNGNDCSLAFSDCIGDELSEDLMRMADEIDICEQKSARVISHAEMEVDPTSICSSASGLITSEGDCI